MRNGFGGGYRCRRCGCNPCRCAQGFQGSAGASYTQLTSDARGERGPGGSYVPAYSATGASTYQKGELIYYNSQLFMVNKSSPSGAPGGSADYSVIGGGTQGPAC